MAFRERIEVVVDFVTQGAQTSLGKLRTDVANTEGALGKMKVGAKGAFDMLGVVGPEMALAAGAALVTFGAKAVNEFNNAALAAGRFSDATGLTNEEASRLIEVAGDLGVEAGTLEGAIRRVNGAAESGALAQYGIDIQTAKDGSYDANATFLETVEAIGKIESAAEREAAARKIMGRSWADLAEMTTMSAEDLRAALAAVSEEKIFNDEDVRQAREYRETMDNLRDVLEDVTLQVGRSLTPAVTDFVDTLTDVKNVTAELDDMTGGAFLEGLKDSINQQFNPLAFFRDQLDDAGQAIDRIGNGDFGGIEDDFYDLNNIVEAAGEQFTRMADTSDDAGESTEEFTSKIQELADALDEDARQAADDAAEAVERLDRRYQALFDTLDAADAVEDIKDGFDDVERAAGEAFGAAVEGSRDAEGKARDYEQALRDQKRRVYEYGQEVLGLPPEALTDVIALIDEGKFAEAQAALDELAKPRTTTLTVKVNQEGTVVLPGGNDARRLPLLNVEEMPPSDIWRQATSGVTTIRRGGRRGGGSAGRPVVVNVEFKGWFAGSMQEMRRGIRPFAEAIALEIARVEKGQS